MHWCRAAQGSCGSSRFLRVLFLVCSFKYNRNCMLWFHLSVWLLCVSVCFAQLLYSHDFMLFNSSWLYSIAVFFNCVASFVSKISRGGGDGNSLFFHLQQQQKGSSVFLLPFYGIRYSKGDIGASVIFMSHSLLCRHIVLLTVGVYSSNHRVLYTIGISMTRRFKKSVRTNFRKILYLHKMPTPPSL